MAENDTACGGFARMAGYVLYGHALKECFLNIEWTTQGFFLFGAVTVTVVRCFLASVLFDDNIRCRGSKGDQFCSVWLSICLAGLAALAARYQADTRLLYVVPALAGVDFAWSYRAFCQLRNGNTNVSKSVMRARMAIDLVMAGFFLSVFPVLNEVSPSAGLPPEAVWLAVTGMLLSAVVDLLLNWRFYWQD